MATYSSTLAQKIPLMEEPGGLQSCGHKESDTTQRLHFHFSFRSTFLLLLLPRPPSQQGVTVLQFSSVQLLSRVRLFATPWTAACQASLSITISQSLLKLMSIESVMPSNHLILCRPLLPSVFPSIRVFFSESVLHIRWPKDSSFSFSISYSNEYSGLISFRTEWFDLLAVQGTVKILQHHSYPAKVLALNQRFMPFLCVLPACRLRVLILIN